MRGFLEICYLSQEGCLELGFPNANLREQGVYPIHKEIAGVVTGKLSYGEIFVRF